MKKQKLKLGAAIVLAVALTSGLIFVACKKNETSANKGAITNKGEGKKITSKYYAVSGKQVTAMVKTFKQSKQLAAKTSSLDVKEDLPLDSAEFLLEATINYDFDYVTYTMDSTWNNVDRYTFRLTENENGERVISASELLNAYQAMQTDFNSIVNDSIKLKAIDIQAYTDVDGGIGYFEATAIIFNIHPYPYSEIRYCSTSSAFSSTSYYFLESVNTLYANIYNTAQMSCYYVNNNAIFPLPPSLNPSAIEPFRQSLICQGPNGLNCYGSDDIYEQYFFNISLPINISSTSNQLNPNLPSVVNPNCASYPSGGGGTYTSWSSNNYFSGAQMDTYVQNVYNNLIAPNLISGTQPFLVPGSVQITFQHDAQQGVYAQKYWWNLSWRRANAACTIVDK